MIKNLTYLLARISLLMGVVGMEPYLCGPSMLAASEHDKTSLSVRYLTPDDMTDDFRYLIKVIKETHPNPYTFFSKEDFEKEEKRLIILFQNPMLLEEYRNWLSVFVAKMRDGHTTIDPLGGHRFVKHEKKVPLLMHWFENDLYIIDVLDKTYSNLKGGKILAVNRTHPDKILERLRSIVFADNDYAIKNFSSIFRFIDIKTWKYILGIDRIESLEITYVAHESRKVKTALVSPRNDTELYQQFCDSEELKIFLPKRGISEAFSFSYNKDLNAGILKWYEFKHKDFGSFLKGMFHQLKKYKAEHLIIDLRWNMGGNSDLGNMLAAYLAGMSDIWDKVDGYIRLSGMYRQTYPDSFKRYVEAYKKINGKEPEIGAIYPLIQLNSDFSVPNIPEKDKFEGDVYVLISPCTYSSAMMIAWQLADNHPSTTLVGEPTATNPCTYGEVLSFVLPKTDIRGGVSCKYFRRTNASLCGQGALYPDFYVPTTYKDFSRGMDTQMVWLEKHLSKKK
jgi:hypothetical protein